MKTKILFRERRGFALVLVAAFMLVVCIIAGLAVDVSRAYVVKTDLQKAADAAALAGAANLFTTSATALPVLSWSNAETAATNYVGNNKADNSALQEGTVVSGYYHYPSPSDPLQKGIIPGTCASSNNPCTTNSDCNQAVAEICMQRNYVPAVKVTITKSAGNNNGAVSNFFSSVVGWSKFQVSASAIAVSGYVGATPPGLALPFAMCSNVATDYFSQNPLPNTTITDISPYQMKNGTYVSPGQWTDLLPGKDPAASTVKDYIDNQANPKTGSPSPATTIGESIYIDTGLKGSGYLAIQNLIAANTLKGQNTIVYLPLTNCPLIPNTTSPIMGYTAFQITSATINSITGNLVSIYSTPINTSAGGGVSSLISAPQLVRSK